MRKWLVGRDRSDRRLREPQKNPLTRMKQCNRFSVKPLQAQTGCLFVSLGDNVRSYGTLSSSIKAKQNETKQINL